jgi:small subunit ribosomal protein S6
MPQNADQQYELTFILEEKAGVGEGRAKTDEVRAYIEEHGGSITKEDLWGRRELAYPIKRNRSGFYITLVFSYPATALRDLEQHLRFDEHIIRSLVTKAYTSAQEGSLAPQEEAEANATKVKAEDKGSGEEMLRRSSGSRPSTKAEPEAESIPDDERRRKLDETLSEMLKD